MRQSLQGSLVQAGQVAALPTPSAAAKAKQHEADKVNATSGDSGSGYHDPQPPSWYNPTPVGGTVGEAYGEFVPSAPPLEPPPPSSFDFDFVPPPVAPAAVV